MDIPFVWYSVIACQGGLALAFLYSKIRPQTQVLRQAILAYLLFAPLVTQLSIESGSASGIVFWSFLAPVAMFISALGNERTVRIWLVGYVLAVIAAFVLDHLWSATTDASVHVVAAIILPINLAIFTLVLSCSLYYYAHHRAEIDLLRKNRYSSLRQKHTELNAEHERTAHLLGNMLPERIVERLLAGAEMIADGHSDVTVMFADLVGFTQLTDTMSPKQIVRLLNQVFSGFDDIAKRHGLEKIKTIGDAYMVVGGLTKDSEDYVLDVVRAAQEFQGFLRSEISQAGRPLLSVHIGIATGPIAAGVIGRDRLTYDIWGSTVNLASRLTGAAPADQIYVDAMTFHRAIQKFSFLEETTLSLKGKSSAKAYRLVQSAEVTNVYSLRG
jgi:adenylate cyclase